MNSDPKKIDGKVLYSRNPSKEGVSEVFLAGSSYTPMDDETRHDLKIMLDNYNRYNDLAIRHYSLKKWATVSFVMGLFFVWAFLVLATIP